MTIYYLITQKCNLSCPHCIRGSSTNVTMDSNAAINGLRNIYASFPDSIIVLSGGEPTIHKDFDILLSEAASLFKTVVINSNGTTAYFQKSRNWMRENVVVQFSVDGNQRLHDKIRGNGTFKKIIENIEYINETGFKIWISTVVSSYNLESIKELPMILCKHKIAKWQVAPVMPFGNAADSLVLNVETWNKLVDELINITPFRLGVRKLFDMNTLNKLSADEILRISNSIRSKNFRNCGCVTDKVYIYPDMTVYPCTCQLDSPIGNISAFSLKEIVEDALNHPYVCLNDVCKKCRFRPICNGGCIGMQKKYGADIRCPLIRENKDV